MSRDGRNVVLFATERRAWRLYEVPLQAALTDVGFHLAGDSESSSDDDLDLIAESDLGAGVDPAEVDYIIYSMYSSVQDFSVFPNLRAVFNLWAGVESVIANPTLKVPLARMVDPIGLTAGMVEWVTGHVLRHHLGIDRDITRTDSVWDPVIPPLAADRRISVLGLGELGNACAGALVGLGFDVAGWSRRARSVEGVAVYSGSDGLDAALSGAQIVVLLLPLTPDTHNVLDARTLDLLAPGAVVINAGRGALIDDDAVLAALDSGRLGHATLDVFRTEPLPSDHRFWSHPSVTVTPHVASFTRPASASKVLATNLRRAVDEQPLLHLVDPTIGY